MAVLLKNLLARALNAKDLVALGELVRLCVEAEECVAGGPLGELLAGQPRLDLLLENDAWVIVTTRGQLAGFACIWREEDTHMTTFLCVHPNYRKRGIGTLLLRMAEVRAREYTRQAAPGQRVVMRGAINSANEGAQRLFEREGYQAGRAFLRISCSLNEESELQELPLAARKLTLDVGLGQPDQPLAATVLEDRDVLCSVSLHRTYEKELRPASQQVGAPISLEAVGI
ncbi:MAG TPA: GNAT family N-acetyltransferase [Ktedonobacteraceae bacterium]